MLKKKVFIIDSVLDIWVELKIKQSKLKKLI